MADKVTRKAPAAKKKSSVSKRPSKTTTASASVGTHASAYSTPLATLRENEGARPKRTRVGRGHGSGMVKTGGEGGKGQTVRSGGGKGPAFEGGQTPWARRLPHKRGYSQKARDIGHFRSTFAVINVSSLADWDVSIEVSPESLIERGMLSKAPDGVKVLGGTKSGKTLPQGLRFRDVAFSGSAREALSAAGANLGDDEPSAEANAGAEA